MRIAGSLSQRRWRQKDDRAGRGIEGKGQISVPPLCGAGVFRRAFPYIKNRAGDIDFSGAVFFYNNKRKPQDWEKLFVDHAFESLIQIIQNIVNMLCANGKPDGIGFNSL